MKTPSCPHCSSCAHVVRHGYYKTKSGKRRRHRCTECRKTFCSTVNTAYYRLQHRRNTFDEVAAMSVEGVSKSAIARVKRLGWNTVDRALESFYDSLSPEQLEDIYAVAMDMWEPYVKVTKNRVPEAAIVFDKFHVVSKLVEAVDKVRRQENKELRKEGDDRLVGTKYHWITNPENLRPEILATFETLRKADLKTSRAWAIKETFTRLWNYTYEGSARKFFKSWFGWARRSRLEPIRKAAQTVKDHLDNILTYLKFPITNAVAEGVNSKIQWVKYTARGFRNLGNFKTAILFHCGGLQLYPPGT